MTLGGLATAQSNSNGGVHTISEGTLGNGGTLQVNALVYNSHGGILTVSCVPTVWAPMAGYSATWVYVEAPLAWGGSWPGEVLLGSAFGSPGDTNTVNSSGCTMTGGSAGTHLTLTNTGTYATVTYRVTLVN